MADRRRWLGVVGIAGALAGCSSPPPGAYVHDDVKAATVPVGRNTAGEACQQDGGSGDPRASIYCGSWNQPSARVAVNEGPAASLTAIAAASPWRETVDRRLDCAPGTPTTILSGDPAVLLACTARSGGWPEVALVAQVRGRIYVADGVAPALPAIQRSIGVLSGAFTPTAAADEPVSTGLTAQRLAGATFKAGDIGQYNTLMFQATQANLSGNYASAEALYRQVAALEERVLGHDAPGLAPVLAAQALNLSNQGQFADAGLLFARAAPLAASPAQSDPLATARLTHYRGLDALNQRHDADALALLREADRLYAAQLPPGSLAAQGGRAWRRGRRHVDRQPGARARPGRADRHAADRGHAGRDRSQAQPGGGAAAAGATGREHAGGAVGSAAGGCQRAGQAAADRPPDPHGRLHRGKEWRSGRGAERAVAIRP